MSISLNILSGVAITGTHINLLNGQRYASTVNVGGNNTYTATDVTKLYTDTRTLATNETLDLTAVVNTGFNVTQNFATLKVLFIQNNSATATLTIGGGTHPILANAILVPAGGRILLEGNRTVSAGSTNNLFIVASASLTYSICLIGI
jgi:hypothetical protein